MKRILTITLLLILSMSVLVLPAYASFNDPIPPYTGEESAMTPPGWGQSTNNTYVPNMGDDSIPKPFVISAMAMATAGLVANHMWKKRMSN